jgi:hypothetical protein
MFCHRRDQWRSGSLALAATLGIGIAGARADDTAKYPDLNGQWSRATAGAQWDPARRLTFAASMAS